MTLPTTPSQATSVPAPASATPPESTPAQPAATPEQPAEQPKYVTKEELAEAIELGFRRAQQSAKDRDQKIETQVKELTARLEKANVPITPEIAQNLRQQVTQELDNQPAETPAVPAAQASAQPGQGDPVYDWTMEAYKAKGMDIKPADPEFAQITAALNDPAGNMVKYQEAVLKAIDAKRERTASQQATADARVLGGGPSTPGGATYSNASEAWQQAYRQK